MLATLLMICCLPIPTFDDRWSCDMIVLNHTRSAGRQYTQLVMIDDNQIVNVEWQPAFDAGKAPRWMLISQVSDFYLVTVTGDHGDFETWKAPQFVETRTTDNTWMREFDGSEEP